MTPNLLKKLLPNIIETLFAIIMLAINAIVLFQSNLSWPAKTGFTWPNLLFLCVGTGMILVLYLLRKWIRIPLKSEKSTDTFVKWGCMIGFFLLFYWCWNYHFKTGWDAGTIEDTATYLALNHGNFPDNEWGQWVQKDYFSMCPNNIFILWLLVLSKAIELRAGIFDLDNLMMVEIMMTCMIMVLTAYFVYKIVKEFIGYKWAFMAWVVFAAYFALSPWTVIFYSDSVGLFFPTAIFYLYLQKTENKRKDFLRWMFMGILSALAYKCKPQAFIIGIALCAVYFLCGECRMVEKVKKLACYVLIFLIVLKACDLQTNMLHLEIDQEKSFGVAHYLMLGMNPDTRGIWSADDYNLSTSYTNAKERNAANIEKIRQRLSDYGVKGYLELLRDKTLITYGDGTFAWGAEGSFWNQIFTEPNTKTAPLARSFYYPVGENLQVWKDYSQLVWTGILFFSLFSVLALRSTNRSEIAVLQLAMIGLFLFEMLFEARARYLYTCVPIYIILSVIGMKSLLEEKKM